MAKTVGTSGHSELIVRRSRFVGDLVSVSEAPAVEALLAERRDQYADASHVVYAFSLGLPGSATIGMSDDHEPHGTAGRPVLDLLLGREISNALLTVVRYFGGTKLGTGGLVRAYSETARLAIEDAVLFSMRRYQSFSCTLPYAHYDEVRRRMGGLPVRNIAEDFATDVTVAGEVGEDCAEELSRLIVEITHGRSAVRFGDD
jgi:uncharacterized YigZ family protein